MALIEDEQLKELGLLKMTIIDIAAIKVFVNVKTETIDVVYDEETNDNLKKIDELIAFRVEQIKGFYDKEIINN